MLLVIVLVNFIFAGMAGVIIFRRLTGRNNSELFKQIALLTLLVDITAFSFGNGDIGWNERLNIWGICTTTAGFILVLYNIVKNKEREMLIALGSLTLFYLIECANGAFFGKWSDVLIFLPMLYEISLYIFIVVLLIKKNPQAILLGKVLLGIYALNIIARAVANYKSVGVFIVEIIIFGMLGALMALPILLVLKKSFPDGKSGLGLTRAALHSELKSELATESSLDDIVD